MKRQDLLKGLIAAGASLLVLGWAAGGALAQGTKPPAPGPAHMAPQSASDKVESDIITITTTIQDEEKKLPVAKGPPSKDQVLIDEAKQRLEFLKQTRDQIKAAEEHVKNARNSAEAQVWQKEIRLKTDTAEGLKQSIVGAPPPRATAPGRPAAAPTNHIEFRSGAFQQLLQANKESTNDAAQRNPDTLRSRATDEFGSGRAGAGGVALYKTATMQTPLDRAKIKGAAVEDDRLVLLYGDQKVKFPAFDPQFLALAIRCVYGGEGLVPGTVVANSPNALVLSTGKDLYGEVVWKKELLANMPANLKVGDKTQLEFGPGLGALSTPDPSMDRITYYGPLKGTILGKVIQESDMVFSMFWYGVDWRTGRPIDPNKTPGFTSAIDLDLAAPAKPAVKRAPLPPSKHWWEDSAWFVWNPADMVLQLSPKSGEFEYVKATMRATAWGWRDGLLRDNSPSEARYLTDHYDDFARAFPVLGQMREAAKTVAAVRWLKQNKVPLDLDWAKTYKLAAVETVETTRRFSVYVNRDDKGRPIVEKEDGQ